jgi:hypothetical protein
MTVQHGLNWLRTGSSDWLLCALKYIAAFHTGCGNVWSSSEEGFNIPLRFTQGVEMFGQILKKDSASCNKTFYFQSQFEILTSQVVSCKACSCVCPSVFTSLPVTKWSTVVRETHIYKSQDDVASE